MVREDLLAFKLPDEPGVYMFRDQKRRILYVGKATSLRDRVRSYFASDISDSRGLRILKMVEEAKQITWEQTDSVLEALILEANLIKKHQPPYNVRDKDNKSFNYLVITKEKFPRVLLVRGRELYLSWNDKDIKHLFGPFPQGGSLKEALKIVRKIFPYRDHCTPESGKPCFNRQIGLCPGVCSGEIHEKEYARTIRNIVLLFSGKKKDLLKKLEKEMNEQAKREEFEQAARTRKQIEALTHIHDIALLKREAKVSSGGTMRIEGFDIAHTSGSETVGVMVVVQDGEIVRDAIRRFRVRGVANNDPAALAEIVDRRLGHPEWPFPRVVVVDGGKAQVNAVHKVFDRVGVGIPIVGVVKDERHRAARFVGDPDIIREHERDIVLVNEEAHRRAVSYHRKRRSGI